MEQIGINYEVPLNDFQSLLATLQIRNQHVIIECENPETEMDDDFFIGQVVTLDDEFVSILPCDSLGEWDPEPSVIAYADITKVQFNTPYISTFSKYLQNPELRYGSNSMPE